MEDAKNQWKAHKPEPDIAFMRQKGKENQYARL